MPREAYMALGVAEATGEDQGCGGSVGLSPAHEEAD